MTLGAHSGNNTGAQADFVGIGFKFPVRVRLLGGRLLV
jgi:hypothetical protein